MTWCPLPWNHLFIRPSGYGQVCCGSVTDYSFYGSKDHKIMVDEQPLEDWFFSENMNNIRSSLNAGVFPSACRKCKQDEDSGIPSRRQVEMTDTKPVGISLDNITHVSISLNNTCNLQCVMCNVEDSSKWGELKKYMLSKSMDETITSTLNWHHNQPRKYDTGKVFNEMIDKCKNVNRIHIQGGEPLLDRPHFIVLEKLISEKRAANIDLVYNTNMSIIPQNAFDIWKHFNHVRLMPSIEHCNPDKSFYIRYPQTLASFIDNIRKIDTGPDCLTYDFRITLQALNALDIDEIVSWINDQNFKKMTRQPSFNKVRAPSYLDARIISPVNHSHINNSLVSSYVKSEDRSKLTTTFFHYIAMLDKKRGTNFNLTFPTLSDILHTQI